MQHPFGTPFLFLLASLTLGCVSCSPHVDNTRDLQIRIDTLEQQLDDAYKPGFGEFMSSIQAHHSKLWFAGHNQNWKLADFEIHELMETFADIRKYQSERKESQQIEMINPAIEAVNNAIQHKSPALFESSYSLLTNTCNNCHRATAFEFNVVKIPDTQPFSNQDFRTAD